MPSPTSSICKKLVVLVVDVRVSTSLPASTCTSVAVMEVSPPTSTFEPCTVNVCPALRSALPPTLKVEPTLRLENSLVAVSVVPYRPPPTPMPDIWDLVSVVDVFSRATMLRLLPASTAASPPTATSVPAKVMSLVALAARLPPTVRPDLICVVVDVVVVSMPAAKPSRITWLLRLELLSSMVSKVMLLPALSEASPSADIWAPRLMMSCLASNDRFPVEPMVAVLPMVVVMLPTSPVVWA